MCGLCNKSSFAFKLPQDSCLLLLLGLRGLWSKIWATEASLNNVLFTCLQGTVLSQGEKYAVYLQISSFEEL